MSVSRPIHFILEVPVSYFTKVALYLRDNYNYEKGKSARISLQWDNQTKTLTIGDRKGSFYQYGL